MRGRSHTHDITQMPNLPFLLPTSAAYDFAATCVGASKFVGLRRIFARISETCQKNCWANFCANIFSLRPFLPHLQKTTFFPNKRTLAATFARFSGIFPGFSGILPKFSTNQTFWGCTCTTASYTTNCSRLLQ